LVGAPRDALPTTDEDEFYWADLIGLEVINAAGERSGQGCRVDRNRRQCRVARVGDDNTERLLPFVAAVVLAVEKEAGLIRVEWGSDW
jgi:16S rRNA processing protein RimM